MRINVILGAVAALAVGSAAATPTPSCTPSGQLGASDTNDETGHFYQVYSAPGITWGAAKAAVDDLPEYQGVKGHLATITSASEDTWVNGLRQTALLCAPEVWIGGVQPPDKATGVDWAWDNGEGPIATFATPLIFSYQNWLNGEPNDNTGPSSENYLAIGLNDQFGWNDEGALGNIGGYVVEYDVPRLAACDPGTGDCQTIRGQSLEFPPGSFGTNTTIAFNGFQFTDPRVATGKCGIDGLTLFGFPGQPQLQIPPYLCGSPDLVVVAVNGDQLNFQSGTVAIENDTNVVLPDNTVKICKDTVGPPTIVRPTPGNDPQQDDVVVYQTTEPERMREFYSSTGVDPQFIPGAAGEFTNGCGSSRGSVKEASYFVVGMHIDFGTTAPELVKQRFVSLTLYKLSLLQQSVNAARAAGVLKNGDTTKMTAQLNNAVKKLGRGDPSGALGHVQQFLKFVNAAKYNTPAPASLYPPDSQNNFNGEHLMRGSNIEFTLRVKIVPNTP